jgi:hypothetical protein
MKMAPPMRRTVKNLPEIAPDTRNPLAAKP